MAWRRPGDKPLSEPVMVSLLTHICVTRPQWVNVKELCKCQYLIIFQYIGSCSCNQKNCTGRNLYKLFFTLWDAKIILLRKIYVRVHASWQGFLNLASDVLAEQATAASQFKVMKKIFVLANMDLYMDFHSYTDLRKCLFCPPGWKEQISYVYIFYYGYVIIFV